jgi:uncharacterized protein GlcG (DUF336 family)
MTAALFQARREVDWEYRNPRSAAPALEFSNDSLAPFAGGIPLHGPRGEMLGAIGVSAGAVVQDLEIAAASVAALAARTTLLL